jgi:asparagine synthetase B (glutamine-hydrolysing)
MAVRVELRGPEKQLLEVAGGTWHLLADRPASPHELPDPLTGPVDWAGFGSRFEELTAVFLPSDEAGNLPCLAFRSLFSGFELFRAETPEGVLLLTDDFRLAGKESRQRKPSVTSLLDYLLFQYPAGIDTFLPGVFRLGPGESLSVPPAEPGRLVLSQAETLQMPPKVSPQEALERVREALPAAVGKALEGSRDAAVLFSGGIDSTLVALFGRGRAAALHGAIDSPELAYEEDYARISSREMNIPLVRVLFSEDNFLEDLGDACRKLGRPFPVTHFQVIFNHRLFQLPYALFLSGDIADRLFGHEPAPTGNGPDSVVSRLVRYCPRDLLCRMFGRDLVESRLGAYEETLGKIAGPGFEELTVSRKLDLLIFFGLNYWIHYFRPLASAYGKRFVAPFGRKPVFEAAMSCPPGHDFGTGHPKPLLREILADLLPGYPREGKKGGSGVPRTRFCQSGPLKDFFRKHELPSEIDPRFAKLFREPEWDTSALVLQAACYRIWEDTL